MSDSPALLLFHVVYNVHGDDLDFYVEAESAQQAVEIWAAEEIVAAMTPGGPMIADVQGEVTVFEVPTKRATAGIVSWDAITFTNFSFGANA